MAITGEAADAEDVLQDSFVTAWQRLAQLRSMDGFRAWLLRIVRNRALNHLDARRVRRAEPIEHAEILEAGSTPAGDAERAELRQRLTQAMAGLSGVQREVVLLHDLEGWKHAEIAELLEMSEVMSRRHLSDARRTLRERLANYREDSRIG